MHGGFAAAAFFRRLAIIAGCAAAVSAVTLFAMPQAPVYFGILHCIASASLLALPFLRWPALVAAAAGALMGSFALAGLSFAGPAALLFTGLIRPIPPMVDYAPLIPFAGVLLLGLAAGKFYRLPASAAQPSKGARPWLRLAAQLLIYLIHQPVLFGATYAAASLTPPQPEAPIRRLHRECEP